MKITLEVHGQEKTFSEEEIISILEKYFSEEATESITSEEAAQVPIEGEWFKVNPLKLDRSKFENPMKDQKQEKTRQDILEAFAELDKHIAKYAFPFYIMIPKKNWQGDIYAEEIKAYANDLGGVLADWVEQALKWAQMICNGVSWETICNNADTANWYRMIRWKDGFYRLVGGSRKEASDIPASDVRDFGFSSDRMLYSTVPLVRFNKR